MNQKNEKGITLIALVITIIVLLILAGVTINMVLGDEGIISNAQEAKEQYSEKNVKEIAQLAILKYKTNKKTNTVDSAINSEEEAIEQALTVEYGLSNSEDDDGYITEINDNDNNSDNNYLFVAVGENKFFIEKTGNIPEKITFKIWNKEYKTENGMTWEEWCDNNTDGYGIIEGYVYQNVENAKEVIKEGYGSVYYVGEEIEKYNTAVREEDIIKPYSYCLLEENYI